MTDEDKKWNKMLDLWVEEELESPYAELTTYYNEVMNGGHYQYDEIIEQCDNEFYDYEDEITELLNKYASEIEL